MIPGFIGCMITGFLGTSGPRLLGTRSLSLAEFVGLLSLALSMMTALGLGKLQVADLLSGAWMLLLLVSMLGRAVGKRHDFPPPGFPLILLGLAGASGTGFFLGTGISTTFPITHFVRLLYFQGILWLPILGVAPYLLPRFFGRRSLHDFDESLKLPVGWLRPFLASFLAGFILISSFALEATGHTVAGHLLRATAVVGHLGLQTPGLIGIGRVNGLGSCVRWALPCSIAGWLLPAYFPHLRIGSLHLMFIGGVGLLVLAVATRVILGHSGRADRLISPLIPWHGLWILVHLTAATRLTADFVPAVRTSHLAYAALLWVVLLGFWTWRMRLEIKAKAWTSKSGG
jgi:hypothetical protein